MYLQTAIPHIRNITANLTGPGQPEPLYEGIMGVKRGYDGLEITPCFPKEWERAEMTRHFRNADYHIVIENPQCRKAVTSVIIVDGTQIKGNRIPDFADNKKHEIKVILQ